MKRARLVLATVAGGLAVVCVGAVTIGAEVFEIPRWTVDGGGVMRSTGGAFELSGTIGQADAGPGASGMSGNGFTLTGGFWFPLAQGDCNTDGGVNLFDYGDLEVCLSGPAGGLPSPECACFDLDGDVDVDLFDAARFQETFTGG